MATPVMIMSLLKRFFGTNSLDMWKEIRNYVVFNEYASHMYLSSHIYLETLRSHGICKTFEHGEFGYNIYSVTFKDLKLYNGILMKADDEYIPIYSNSGIVCSDDMPWKVEFNKQWNELITAYYASKDEIHIKVQEEKLKNEQLDKERHFKTCKENMDKLNKIYGGNK